MATTRQRPPQVPAPRRNGAVGAFSPPPPAMTAPAVDPGAPSCPGDPARPRPPGVAAPGADRHRLLDAARERYRVSVEEYVRFHEQGFLVVTGLLNPAEVAELTAALGGPDVRPGGTCRGWSPRRRARARSRSSGATCASTCCTATWRSRSATCSTPAAGRPGGADRPGRDGDADDVLRQGPRAAPARATTRTATTSPPTPTSSAGPGSRSTGRTRRTAASGSPPARSTSRSTPPTSGWGRTTPTCATWRWSRTSRHTDTEVNTLSRIAARYPGQERRGDRRAGRRGLLRRAHPAPLAHQPLEPDRFRRALVCHYANARSFTMWGQRRTGRSRPTTCTSWPAAGRTSPSAGPASAPPAPPTAPRRLPRTGGSRCPRP